MGLVVATATLAALPAAAQLSSTDSKCIETINKDTRKVLTSQGKVLGACAQAAAKGTLTAATVLDCASPATNLKVQKAVDKAVAGAAKRCPTLPPFGPPTLDQHPLLALSAGTNFMTDLYGTPVDDAVLTDSAGAACQKVVLKAAQKCQAARLKEVEKCKKLGMRAGTITSADELRDQCLGTGTTQPDPKGKIDKACTFKLTSAVSSRCALKGVPMDTAFPGCGVDEITGTATCIDQRMLCRTCELLNAVDGLTRDCDLLDDGDDDNDSCAEPTTCGDGIIDGLETCDDGNDTPGDGCSASCMLEAGWDCSGEPTVCTSVCGDGLVVGTEGCDDGGTTPGDGCDATCGVETGYSCAGEPSVCAPICGDGLITGAETCDDGGATPGDGCSDSCQLESGWDCSGEPTVCTSVCGDGLVRGTEACDDSATLPGDGCSATCEVETGFECAPGDPSVCTAICGDGFILGGEACDDGGGSAGGAFPGGSPGGGFVTPVAGDGCDEVCQIEIGWGCSGEPSDCTPICGDTLIRGDETCDDGDVTPGDGCDGACMEEAGWVCDGAEPTGCVSICGDGLVVGSEGCDDGDIVPGDGCDDACEIEAGYACTGAPSTCAPICGDGVIISPEGCDDGGTLGGDGCSATCEIEPGFVCGNQPSTCNPFSVVISSPANGDFDNGASVTVTGDVIELPPAVASLTINGTPVPVAGNGSFSTSLTLDQDDIFNPIRATVVDGITGSAAHDRVVVIAGDSVADGDLSFESVALRLNDTGLDEVEPLVADLAGDGLDLADLVPVGTVLIDNQCFIDSFLGCTGRGTVRVKSPAPSFTQPFQLAIDSMTNFVAGDITVNDIDVNVRLDGSGLVPSCDINIFANQAFFFGDYALQPASPDPTSIDVNQVGPLAVSFSGFSTSFGGICDVPIIGDIIQAFLPDVEALTINAIRDFLTDPDGSGPQDGPIADGIEDALAGISITGPIGQGLGVNLDAPLFEVAEDNAGITLGSDSRFTAVIGTNPGECSPPAGAPDLDASYAVNQTFPTFGATTPVGGLTYDLGICISSEGFNQLLKAQTECGLLVTSINELEGTPLTALLLGVLMPEFLAFPPATPFRIDIRPTLAPIVGSDAGPGGELAELKIAQVLASIVQDDGSENVVLVGAFDADIGLDLEFAPGGLGVTLAPPDPADITVAILVNPLGVDEGNLENNVLPPLVSTLLPDLAGSLAGFPLPSFFGLDLNGVEVSRNGEFMSLFADLEPAP